MWHVPDGRLMGRIDDGEAWQFYEGADFLAVSTGRLSVELLSASTGRPLATLTGHTNSIHGMWFSPDGMKLATASDDRTVRIWQLPS